MAGWSDGNDRARMCPFIFYKEIKMNANKKEGVGNGRNKYTPEQGLKIKAAFLAFNNRQKRRGEIKSADVAGGGVMAWLATVVARVGMLFMVILAVGSAAAEWEIVSLNPNPLDDKGDGNFVSRGDFVSPVPGYGVDYPYKGLQAKLRYSCDSLDVETAKSFGVGQYHTVLVLFFNKKPNVKTRLSEYGTTVADFRVKGDGGKTRDVGVIFSHLRGFTFTGSIEGSLLVSFRPFTIDDILSHNSVIVGVPWFDRSEVLFEFQVTPEMKAGVAEINSICERLNGENESRDDEIKEKTPPAHRK